MNTVLSLMFGDAPSVEDFSNTYRCYSFDMHEGSDLARETLRRGGHILLPQSALGDMSVGGNAGASVGPMIFSVTSNDQSALAGVHEFTAPEGVILAPDWLMRRLRLSVAGTSIVRVSALPPDRRPPLGTFARLRQRQSEHLQTGDFLSEVEDPKAVLERRLRDFICLSVGDEIELELDGRRYLLDVVELRPAASIFIVDCDLAVDFDTSLCGLRGIRERTVEDNEADANQDEAAKNHSETSSVGAAARVDGSDADQSSTTVSTAEVRRDGAAAAAASGLTRGQPNLNYKPGTFSFPQHRHPPPVKAQLASQQSEIKFKAFSGSGHTLGGASRPSRIQNSRREKNRAGHCCELPVVPSWG